MRTPPTLSVIVPVTKMSGRLEALDSWLTKIHQLPIEIIIIHDIQDTNTSAELVKLIETYGDLRLVFVEGEYGSPGAARNEGLNFLTGNWVAFWDSDDLPVVDEVMLSIYESPASTDVIIGNFWIIEKDQPKVKLHRKRIELVALNPGLWRMIFRSEFVTSYRFENLRMGEDQLFMVNLNLPSLKIHFTERVLYHYQKGHPLQLTASTKDVGNVYQAFWRVKATILSRVELQNIFSRIIETRLFLTSIQNIKSKRLEFIINNPYNLLLLIILPGKLFFLMLRELTFYRPYSK